MQSKSKLKSLYQLCSKFQNPFYLNLPQKDFDVQREWVSSLEKILDCENKNDLFIKQIQQIDAIKFKKIEQKYLEEDRHYHNSFHILKLIEETKNYLENDIKMSFDDRIVLFFSIWFHDIIYNPKSSVKGQNEIQSAEEFKNIWQEILSKENIIDQCCIDYVSKTVNQIILSTISHRVPDNCDNYVLKLFLDLDLSVLGWPEDDYKEYCERVRAEYQHIEDLDFVNGRIKVLKHLSKVDQELDKNIYFTEWGQKKFQEQALVNMSNEILWLNEIKDKIQQNI